MECLICLRKLVIRLKAKVQNAEYNLKCYLMKMSLLMRKTMVFYYFHKNHTSNEI